MVTQTQEVRALDTCATSCRLPGDRGLHPDHAHVIGVHTIASYGLNACCSTAAKQRWRSLTVVAILFLVFLADGVVAGEAQAELGATSSNGSVAALCRRPSQQLCASEVCSRRDVLADLDPLVEQTSVPRPWEPDLRSTAYVFPEDSNVKSYFTGRRATLNKDLKALGPAAEKHFARLRRDGFEWNAVGIDFTRLLSARHSDAPSRVLEDDDVKLAVDLFLYAHRAPDTKHFDKGATWGKVMWELDQPLRLPACSLDPVKTSSEAALRRFLANGFVKFKDFSKFGVDVDVLRDQAAKGLQEEGFLSMFGCWTSHAALPALEPLLKSAAFAKIVRGYLGGSARFDGYYTFHLPADISAVNYTAGHWHHDRCGRRIRMAILLHDVTDTGKPTLVAAGSHNLAHYSHIGPYEFSRYTDEYVRSQYVVRKMTGKAGSGFLLDTNALHRGDLGGHDSRTVVFLEFHAHRKVPALFHVDKRGETLPCPSTKQLGRKPLPYNWMFGKPGYRLYPLDVDGPGTLHGTEL